MAARERLDAFDRGGDRTIDRSHRTAPAPTHARDFNHVGRPSPAPGSAPRARCAHRQRWRHPSQGRVAQSPPLRHGTRMRPIPFRPDCYASNRCPFRNTIHRRSRPNRRCPATVATADANVASTISTPTNSRCTTSASRAGASGIRPRNEVARSSGQMRRSEDRSRIAAAAFLKAMSMTAGSESDDRNCPSDPLSD